MVSITTASGAIGSSSSVSAQPTQSKMAGEESARVKSKSKMIASQEIGVSLFD